jgi:hypothetical protein
MADTKISALTASTTPLAGTEVLPIVQGGVTKQVSVANLTTGRAISATQLTLTTGNLIVASGQGIDFSATPGTGTSELLNDYEEGIWTPIDASGAGLTFSGVNATYTKVGRLVTCSFTVNYPVTVSAAAATIGGLPFTSGAYGPATIQGFFSITTATIVSRGVYGTGGGTTVNIDKNNATAVASNADMSGSTSYITITYQI